MIINWLMEPMHGDTATREIRERERQQSLPRMPIIIESGAEEGVALGIDAGADVGFYLFTHPWDLSSAVSRLLAGRLACAAETTDDPRAIRAP